jgi:hypothetical protein
MLLSMTTRLLPTVTRWIWLDSCLAQFKARSPIYHVTQYPDTTNVCHMKSDYFGTSHGKGEVCILLEFALNPIFV